MEFGTNPLTQIKSKALVGKQSVYCGKIYCNGEEFEDQKDASFYMTSQSNDDVKINLPDKINKYAQLAEFKDYDIVVANSGTKINIGSRNDIQIFSVTNKINDYFDLVGYFYKDGELRNCNFGNTNYPNYCSHSGDIGNLLHYIISNKQDVTIGVVGYRKKYLRTFKNQTPFIVAVNYDEERLYVIPCSLSENDIGNSTLALLGRISYENEKYYFLPFQSNYHMENVDTENMNDSIRKLVNMSLEENEIIENVDIKIKQIENKETEPVKKEKFNFERDILQVNQNDVINFLNNDFEDISHFLNFSLGINISNKPNYKKSIYSLPLAFGIITGNSCVLSTKMPNKEIEFEEYTDYLNNKCKFICCTIDDSMNQVASNTCNYRVNGLFIIKPKILKNSLEETLNSLNRAGTIMAGPNSIVLVMINERLYFYRGVKWQGLFDHVPDFRTDVTEYFTTERISNFIKFGGIKNYPWKKIEHISETNIFFKGEYQKLDNVVEGLIQSPLTEIEKHKSSLYDALTQLQVVVKEKDIANIQKKLVKNMYYKLEEMKTQYNDQKKEGVQILQETGDREPLKEVVIKIKNNTNKFKPLIKIITALSSQRASTSRDADIKTAMRRQKINDNVKKTLDMTNEKLCEYMEQFDGLMLFPIKPENFNNLLENISNENMIKYMINCDKLHLERHDRNQYLDGITVSALLEISNSKSIVINKSQNQTIPTIILPMSQKFVDCPDIWTSYYNFIDMANMNEFAIWRIQFRKWLSNYRSRFSINSSSRDLSYGVINCLIDCMYALTKDLEGLPNFDDTVAKMIRSLMGLLFTTLASGQVPLSNLYSFFGGKVMNLKKIDFWILSKIINLFPYTGWNSCDNRVKEYLVRYLRIEFIEPHIKKIKEDKNKILNFYKSRNDEVAWFWIVSQVIKEIQNDKFNPTIIKKLLEIKPNFLNQSKGTYYIIEYLNDCLYYNKILPEARFNSFKLKIKKYDRWGWKVPVKFIEDNDFEKLNIIKNKVLLNQDISMEESITKNKNKNAIIKPEFLDPIVLQVIKQVSNINKFNDLVNEMFKNPKNVSIKEDEGILTPLF